MERLLVGNKCDLESKRAVPYETIQKVSLASCDLNLVTMAPMIYIDGRGTECWIY